MGLDCFPGNAVDIVSNPDAKGGRINLEDNTCSFIYMSHVLEHLNEPLVVMEELWRVSKPGALILVRVPYGKAEEAWVDPTHKRPYYPGSFIYFAQPKYHKFNYGYNGDWGAQTIILNKWSEKQKCFTEMICMLRCIKPARERDVKALNSAIVLKSPFNIEGDIIVFLLSALLGANITKYSDANVIMDEYSVGTISIVNEYLEIRPREVRENEDLFELVRSQKRDIVYKRRYKYCLVVPGKGSLITNKNHHMPGIWSFPLNWWHNDYVLYEQGSSTGNLDIQRLYKANLAIVEGKACLLGVTSHFGHFFVDLLDRLISIELNELLLFDKFVVDSEPSSIILEILRYILDQKSYSYITSRLVWPSSKEEFLYMEDLTYYPLRGNKYTISQDMVRHLRNTELYIKMQAEASDKVLIINRSYAATRKVLGLTSSGHTNAVDFEPYKHNSYHSQVRLFAAANHIVSPMCSELYNMVWCKENTKVTLLVGEKYLRQRGASISHYLSLADSCKCQVSIKILKERGYEGDIFNYDLVYE